MHRTNWGPFWVIIAVILHVVVLIVFSLFMHTWNANTSICDIVLRLIILKLLLKLVQVNLPLIVYWYLVLTRAMTIIQSWKWYFRALLLLLISINLVWIDVGFKIDKSLTDTSCTCRSCIFRIKSRLLNYLSILIKIFCGEIL